MINVGIVRDSSSMAHLLRELEPGNGPFVIVPNWHCALEGYGTDARTVDCLLEALPGEKTVVESYDGARTDDPGRFQGLDLEDAREHRDYLREQDQLFLSETGIGKVLERHGVGYLNVTEEVWAGSVHLWETLELLYWLDTFGYDGWHSLDIYPYRVDPVAAAEESIRRLRKLTAFAQSLDEERLATLRCANDVAAITTYLGDAVLK